MEQTPRQKRNDFRISKLAVTAAGLTLVAFFALGYGAASAFHFDDTWQGTSASVHSSSAKVDPREPSMQRVEYLPAVLTVKTTETEPLPEQF